MYRTYPFILIPSLLAGTLFAQSRSVDVDSLIQFAFENHPRLQVADSDSEAARQQTLQAGRLPDPEVAWGYFLERMDTRQNLSVRQAFPWPGTRASQRESARLSGEAVQTLSDLRRLELAQELREAYWKWGFEMEVLDLLQRHILLVRPMVDVVENRVANDQARASELLRMELILDELEDSMASQGARIDVALNRLKRAMGLSDQAAFDFVPEASLWDELSPTKLAAELPSDHPWIEQYVYRERAADEAERATRYGNRPRWMLGAEWMDNAGPAKDEVMVMVSFSVPIWRESNAASIAESRARSRSARAQRSDAEAEWREQWSSAYRQYEDARRKADRYRSRLIPRGEDALEAEIEAYSSGRGDLLSLLETQRLLLDLEREALNARLELHLSRTGLQFLSGENPVEPQFSTPNF